MKKKIMENCMVIGVVLLVMFLMGQISVLPWWSFAVPVLLFGAVVGIRRWQVASFWMGFLGGFLLWFGANYFFDVRTNGIIFNKIGAMFTISRFVVLVLSGITGGAVAGLALYTGKSMARKAPILLPESDI